MGSKGKESKKPRRDRGKPPVPVVGVVSDLSHNFQNFTYSFDHMHQDYCADQLSDSRRAKFHQSLEKRRPLTWSAIQGLDRHKLGYEWLSPSKKKMSVDIPEAFPHKDQFMVFRYFDKLPMGGVRDQNVFHVVWVERHFGEVYDHGS